MLAICVESSHARGMGHVFRALNLAARLREDGRQLMFFLNEHQPAMHLIAEHGFPFEIVPLLGCVGWERDVITRHGVKLWVNDRLNTSQAHASIVKSCGIPLVTFDDRGDGARFSDLNIAALVFDPANSLHGARVLQGSEYLVLNPAIAKFQRRRKALNSILVTMGGSDTYGVTIKVVNALATKELPNVTVVVGPAFGHMSALEACLPKSFVLKRNVPSLAEEFWGHDLAVTGGGVTPFEAAASGLPCAVIASEDFEVPVGKALERMNAAIFLGHHHAVDWSSLSPDVDVAAMSEAGMNNIGVSGAARVSKAIADCMQS